MKNIRKFETTAEMENAVLEDVSVSYVNEENKVYTTPENGGQSDSDYSAMYTTFVALEDGAFSFTKKGTGDDIQYSKDNGSTWTPLASGEPLNVVTGDKVMWKSTITPNFGFGSFSSNAKFNVSGNIMSLLYGDDFKKQTNLEGKDYAFYILFENCSFLIDASNLILPATTLANSCYQYMFSGCTSLTTAPELPATTLADYCYTNMFHGCTSLTTAPELPALNLATQCYYGMFYRCYNLTTSPSILPATTLADYCYYEMFYGCARLTTAPELPATTLAYSCYYYMFNLCTSLTTAPELPATTLASKCYQGMFVDCTSLTTAPELPATTLASSCYQYMFTDCTNLKHITMLATDISASKCLKNWVSGVASTGAFTKHKDMTSLPSGVSGIPEGWAVEDAIL